MKNKWEYSGFKNEGLYAVEYQIKLKIEALKELVEDDEKSVLRTQKSFENQLEFAKYKEMEEQHQDAFEEHLIDRELIIQNILIQKRYSTCLLIFSVFEGILKEICLKNDLIKQKFVQEDLKGNDDLSRYRNYLKDVVKLNFTKIESSFTKLKQQKLTRNRIAHNNGRVKDSREIQIVLGLKIQNMVIKIEGIQYFNYLTKEIEDFFNQLLIEIDIKT